MAKVLSDYYEQDLVRPSAVFHGCDFGDKQDNGEFGYVYNFLDYYFEEDGVHIYARHYLDNAGEISIVDTNLNDLLGDFGQRVLMFLMLRYQDINIDAEALPEDLMKSAQTRLANHMQQFL